MAELTILMPVYNSISRNGDGYIQQALNSLLNQTFKDFELHILDNQSSDDTAKICKEYANKDKRIKFKIDTKQRFPEDGVNKLTENVNTKYLMAACCDDLWNHYYIEELMKVLKNNPTIDMIYSNGSYIDINNNVGNKLIRDTSFDYTFEMQQNFCLNTQFRSAVPLVFGIFKSKSYLNALPYITFDAVNANIDNLFLARFFLNNSKAKLLNKELFYYRNRERKLEPEKIDGMPTNPILIWVYYINHQLNFYNTISKYIPVDKPLLNLVTLDSCFRCIGPLLLWVLKDLAQDEFERNILRTIQEKYNIIQNLLLTIGYPKLTPELYKNTYRKIEILETKILEYILNIVIDDTLVLKTIDNINEIKRNLPLKSN